MKVFLIIFSWLITMPGLVFCAEFTGTGTFNVGTFSKGSQSPQLLLGGSAVLGADHVYKELGIEARGGYASYKADYSVIPYGPSITINGLSLDEDRYDYAALASYAFKFAPASIKLLAGYHGVILDNQSFHYHIGGPEVGLRGDLPVGAHSFDAEFLATPIAFVSAKSNVSRVYSITDSSTPAIGGDPYLLLNYSATWWLPGFSRMHLGIGYDGEIMLLQREERYANSLALRVKF